MDEPSTSDAVSSVRVRVARVVPRTEVEGPGVRTAVWVQGCSIRCAGCFNPHLWEPHGGAMVSVAALLSAVLEQDVEGITLLGGEPFDQPAPLGVLARTVQKHGRSVMTFTGHTLTRLRAREDAALLLAHTDLLVDGMYRADLPDSSRPWVGSTNQRFHFLTERYRALKGELHAVPDRLEVSIGRDGLLSVTGWAPGHTIHDLLEGLGERETRPPTPRLDKGH
jgi:anaerobic ribonucleoside-triphosphate reductase activating protein